MKGLAQKVLEDLQRSRRDLFDSLSEEERGVVLTCLQQLQEGGRSPTLDLLWELDYERRPVAIDEFLENPEFLGIPLDKGRAVYDRWREELRKIFSPDRRIWEVVFTGAIGTGKSTIATICLLYKLYRLSCLRDPQRFYDLIGGSVIAFGLYSVFKYKVETTTFAMMESLVSASPYFRENFQRDLRYRNALRFPKEIRIIEGSTELHAIGETLYSVVIDEADFMRQPKAHEELGQAHRLHQAVERRVESRFMRQGRVPGLICLVSSKRDQSDYVERHIRGAIGKEGIHVCDFALWDVKPRRFYGGATFRVLVGDRLRASKILPEGEGAPLGVQVVEVPVEHRRPFERDPEQALRDIAGVATYGLQPFLPQRERVQACIDESRVHPFGRESVTIGLSTQETIEDFFLHQSLLNIRLSRYTPKVNPDRARYVHVDLALVGFAGFSMGHFAGVRTVARTSPEGIGYETLAPKVYMDLVLRIEAPPGDEIDIGKIIQFIVALRTFGFPIAKVSFDGFQSAHGIQVLRKQGFEAELLSVDKTDEPYVHLRRATLEGCLSYYRYEPYLEEIVHLRRDLNKGKIEKLPGYTKDVADSVAGVCHHVITSTEAIHAQHLAMPATSRMLDAMKLSRQKAPQDPMDDDLDWVVGHYADKDHLIGTQ